MTNDLNDHEQWGSFTCHLLGHAYMSLFERQGVRLPISLEIS